ncbi:MAG: DUF4956 domain-containing protein [Lachnospiraceae bacterium]|nr:DUF4956 domain-containing protein [Lachnospiraceae bacterium]
MNTFGDIFKRSFLEGFSGSDITTGRIVATLSVTAVLALYIFAVYYAASKKTFYNKTFNISLSLIAMITAGILLAMQSNLVISLGMVGALSIVRFRTAIKDPMDLMFLFWSISIGIICGAQMYKIAILMSLAITVFLFLLELTPAGKGVLVLVVNAKADSAEEEILSAANRYAKGVKVRSRNLSPAGLDLILELRSVQEKELLSAVSGISSVVNASLMEHSGEITI